jgi:hypothetical protein
MESNGIEAEREAKTARGDEAAVRLASHVLVRLFS